MSLASNLERELYIQIKENPRVESVEMLHFPTISVASIFSYHILREGPETHLVVAPNTAIDPEDIQGLEQFRQNLIGGTKPSFQRRFRRRYAQDGTGHNVVFPEMILLGSNIYRVFDPDQGSIEEQIQQGVRIDWYEEYRISPDSLPREVGHYIRVRPYPNITLAQMVFENERNYHLQYYDDRLRFFITRGQVDMIRQSKNPYLP